MDTWAMFINSSVNNLSASVNEPLPLPSTTHSPASSTASLDISNLPDIIPDRPTPLEVPLPPSNPNSPYIQTYEISLGENPHTPPKNDSTIPDIDQTPKASSYKLSGGNNDFQESQSESSREALKRKKVRFSSDIPDKPDRNLFNPPSVLESLEEIQEFGIHQEDKNNLRRFDEAIQRIKNPLSKERLAIMKERVEFTKSRYDSARWAFKNNYKFYWDNIKKD